MNVASKVGASLKPARQFSKFNDNHWFDIIRLVIIKKMNSKDFEIAATLKKRLSEVINLIDIKVFGSRASGKSDQFSDLDVFIVVETLNKSIKSIISEIAWEVGFDNYLVISTLIFTRDDLENSALRSSPIVKNVMRDGVTV